MMDDNDPDRIHYVRRVKPDIRRSPLSNQQRSTGTTVFLVLFLLYEVYRYVLGGG